jgi:hypothetical protein
MARGTKADLPLPHDNGALQRSVLEPKPPEPQSVNTWRIETSHHSRDVTFREDASRIRKNLGVFVRLRSFACNTEVQ